MSDSGPVDRLSIRAPSLFVPAHSCDCHCHIIGLPEGYPFSPNRSYTPAPALLAQYRQTQRAMGFERLVLVQPTIYGTDNRCLLDALDQVGTASGRGIVAVEDDVSVEELDRLHRLGVRGIRYNLVHGRHDFATHAASRLAAQIVERGWHVEMYVDGDLLPQLFGFLSELPAPVVIDHMGQIATSRGIQNDAVHTLRRLLDGGNAWVKLSGYRASSAGYPFADLFALASVLIGEVGERCVWGSDWPHANFAGRAPDAVQLLNLLSEWAPSDAVLRKILVDNPTALYGFAP